MPKGRPWEYDPPFDAASVTDTAAGMEFGTDAAGGRAISEIQATRGIPAVVAGAGLAAGASALPAMGAAAAPAAGKMLDFFSRFQRVPTPPQAAQAATQAAPKASGVATEARAITDQLVKWKFDHKLSDGQIIAALREQYGIQSSIAKQMLRAMGGK